MPYRRDLPGWLARKGAELGPLFIVSVFVASLAGCDVRFDAPDLIFHVHDDEIIFAEADARQGLVGGETVLIIRNASSRERRIVLARIGGLESLPKALLEAELPGDHKRIVNMTHTMAPKTSGNGDATNLDSARFHIYLSPDERYILFDRLSPLEDSLMLEFSPGENRSRSPEQAAAWQ